MKEKREFLLKLLHDFRLECLPFGTYPDHILIEFIEKWMKQNETSQNKEERHTL